MQNTPPTNSANALELAIALIFSKLDMHLQKISYETESQEYAALNFFVNHKNIAFRQAKITPTKTGQFVTFWKRNAHQITVPHQREDHFDFLIVQVQFRDRLGQFVFPKSVLVEKGLVTNSLKEGKRGFRVYPAWDRAENSQAIATQKWQVQYFSNPANLAQAKSLFKDLFDSRLKHT